MYYIPDLYVVLCAVHALLQVVLDLSHQLGLAVALGSIDDVITNLLL